MRRLLWLALAALALAGCSGDGAPYAGGGGGEHLGADAGGACLDPAPGCPCEPGAEPQVCYSEPEPTQAGLFCREGRMHCRDGTWSACETVRTFTLDRGLASLITEPTECNPCNPDCFETVNRPDGTELNGDNSTNVVHDPTEGGVILEEVPVNPSLPDSDMDGLPDLGEDVVANGGIFHVLPYGGASQISPVTANVQLLSADVYFLIDNSGSMGGELANLKADLTAGEFIAGCPGGLIGAIQCTIPDTWVGVGSFVEYPVDPYGVSGNLPYVHHLDITDDTVAAQNAVNGLSTNGNKSWPESATQALYTMATGNGLNGFVPSQGGCGTDEWGYACFRPDSIPIVVLITDAPFHNGPNPAHDYEIHNFALGQYDVPPTVVPIPTDGSLVNIGSVTGTWVTAAGDTTTMASNVSYCSGGASADAAFNFTLDEPARVLIETTGSSFDTVLTVFNRVAGYGWCDATDPGYGLGEAMELDLPAGTHSVFVDGVGDTNSGPFQVNIGTTLRPNWQDTVAALNAGGFKVVVVESSAGEADAFENSLALANATGSADSTGSPFVFSIPGDGTGLSASVVDAVDRLSKSARFDVQVRPVDPAPDGAEEAGPDNGVDERGFVQSITPVGVTGGDCTGTTADGFTQCTAGSQLTLEVEFANDFVPPLVDREQVFDFELEVVVDGVVQQTIPVRIVVPAEVPTYPSAGEYHRDFDSSLVCEVPPERPDWGILSWEVSTPSDTAVRFEVRGAATEAGLSTAEAAAFTIPADQAETGSIDVQPLLLDAGLPINEAFLRITAVLEPSSDQLSTPVLYGFDFQFNCVAGE